jgi:hypothetical protein
MHAKVASVEYRTIVVYRREHRGLVRRVARYTLTALG